MMTNMFSTFDPATSTSLSMNWMSIMLPGMMIPTAYWIKPTRLTMATNLMTSILSTEFNNLMGKKHPESMLMLISLFLTIIITNTMSLMPYTFTSSAHMTYTLTLAMPMWLSLMILGWTKTPQQMLAHLIPTSTPPMLMPLMVCIETTSNLIRPGSLSVRLMANMTAGHLFKSIPGKSTKDSHPYLMPIMLSIQTLLLLVETSVSIIQAYVFSMLMTLYSSEINYENK